ncbi:unnamed protein product [Didymodactylos carnosus]|uniref:Uncharacterized protein n=1 Tax=Didymodactylos carnosus TaxID=1234261 RepID=A0A814UTR2_9BILA|nr:unnamed protein product [Didymodactylos carnosus]CAF3942934.1 unnamed protein product [Didymodactylos carnosus]
MGTRQSQFGSGMTKFSSIIRVKSRKSKNLETFSLIWIDENANKTEDNLTTQKRLRAKINFLKIFEKIDECEQYIQKIKDEKIILIVSGSVGRQLVPKIHDLTQLSAIYVYCMDKINNEKWAKDYIKVRSVVTQLNELVSNIIQDQKRREKIEEPLAMTIFKREEATYTDLKSENANFMWFQLFIDVLIRLEQSAVSKTELVLLGKEIYKGNEQELDIIEEFDKNYKPSKAIWWYTRECFLFRLLNKGFRVQDIDILFAYRFLITDMYKQLKQTQSETVQLEPVIHVYRGQAISIDELNHMKTSIGELISMSSFFSTSLQRETAVSFLRLANLTDLLQLVLFEIKADRRIKAKPFANITQLSFFQDEQEICFCFGSIFRIQNVVYDKQNNFWIVRLELCNDDDHDLRFVYAYMKNEMGEETGLLSLGKLLWKVGNHYKAEMYYTRLLDELEDDDPDLATCYEGLGNIADDRSQFDQAINMHTKALEIRKKTLSPKDKIIAFSYVNIGVVYTKNNELDLALKNYLKALDIVSGSQDLTTATIYNNIGELYRKKAQYDLACQHLSKSLSIRRALLPENHPGIAVSYSTIGNVCCEIGDYQSALVNYQKTLDIRLKTIPKQRDTGKTYRNIAIVYELCHQYQSALFNYNQALRIWQQLLEPTHPDILKVKEEIKQVNQKLYQI